MKLHTDEKPFKCKECHMAFRQSNHLKTHKLRHSINTIFFCKFSYRRFKTQEARKNHEMSCQRLQLKSQLYDDIKKTNSTRLMCLICMKCFSTIYSRNRHSKTIKCIPIDK